MARTQRDPLDAKRFGAYYTPTSVATTLVGWVARSVRDRLLDPSCGDGQFVSAHRNSVGIEQNPRAAQAAMEKAPWALIHEGDFFAWAEQTRERFEAAGGNPPFIRYQTFKGEVRERALSLCRRLGVGFNGLASSWAPFLVVAASLLKPRGKMGFVVPAEIGHAPYAAPLLEFLTSRFETVHIIAYRKKIFPDLSEDCWLLFAEGYGGNTDRFRFSALDTFEYSAEPPKSFRSLTLNEWRHVWNGKLRPLILPKEHLEIYAETASDLTTRRMHELARVGIGYVTGDNDFFHFRPSEAEKWDIPVNLLRPTVRRAEYLQGSRISQSIVDSWKSSDEKVLLLTIPKSLRRLPKSVERYLDSEAGHRARTSYKCSTREPWYSVPDVKTPDFFMSYMSGSKASFVQNEAACTCTNSVHGVNFYEPLNAAAVSNAWFHPFVELSRELEGHPLGGGMLKLEPSEASNIAIPSASTLRRLSKVALSEAVDIMRAWRHHGRNSQTF